MITGGPAPTVRVNWPQYTMVIGFDSVAVQTWYLGATNQWQYAYPGLAIVNSGLNGDNVSNVDANWATRVQIYNPTHLVVLIGINDARAHVDGPTFAVSYQSIINKTRAAFPNCKITHCTLMVAFEDWPSGANPDDAYIEAICSRIRTIAAADAKAYPGFSFLLDFRADMYAKQEPPNNPTHQTSGVLYDAGIGLHPTVAGKVIACAQFLATVPFP